MVNKKTVSDKGNAIVGFIIIIAIVWGLFFLFFGKEEGASYEPTIHDSTSIENQDYGDYEYEEEPRYFGRYECTDDCSGHEAGYNWAEENGIEDEGDCGGNSNSFIEGCRAYVEENY